MWRWVLLLVIGNCAGASSVIFVKDSGLPPAYLSSYRLLLGSLLLLPIYLRDRRRYKGHEDSARFKDLLLPGFLLAVHFITWTLGARMTLAAHATLIVNMNPVVMPFLLFAMLREKVNRPEIAGTLLAMVGVGILARSDFQASPTYFLGDIICFISMVLFVLYFTMGRKYRRIPSVWLYVVPVYFIGGVITFLCGLPMHPPWKGNTPWDFLMVLGLALFPTMIGHSTLNYCVRKMRGQVVALSTVSQFIFAGIMAYFHPRLGEVPTLSFILSSLLVIAGVGVALLRGHE